MNLPYTYPFLSLARPNTLLLDSDTLNMGMGMGMLYCLIALLLTFITFKLSKKNKPPPQSPFALPILGHLYLFKNPLHRTFQTLSNKYGPILFLRFGFRQVLVVSSPSVVEQCFTQNDVIFANRPTTLSAKHLGYNSTVVSTAPYGDRWRNLRRVTTLHIFSTSRIRTYYTIRDEETRFLLHQLYQESKSNGSTRKVINLHSIFFQLTFNVAMKMVAGTRCSKVYEIFTPGSFMSIGDFLPVLRWVFKGTEKKLMKLNKERDLFLQGLINDYRRKKTSSSSSSSKDKKQRKTIIEDMLDLQEAEPEAYTDAVIKGIIQTMFTAGTDTSARTMEWAMSLLLNHPDVLQKAKKEIYNYVEEGRLLDDSDLPKFPYLHCIINETLRLFPVAPLLVPHYSSEDCTVNEFKVPRGTILIVNAWAIHRNPDVWDEPTTFKPERFEGVEVGREGYKFIPFGIGRRACPGAGLALRIIGLALGRLIQCFDWERVGTELVDLSEDSGVTMPKTKPLEAVYSPSSTMTSLLSKL